jgi:redox-sensing transcriptional repressor
MASIPSIPDIVIGRLPIYLRMLNQFVQQGQEVTSASELGQRLGINPARIRKDLSRFGRLGKEGTGYHIHYLRVQLQKILRIDREWPMVVAGAGDLGRAVAQHGGFVERGFPVVAIFDDDPAKIGTGENTLKVMDIALMGDFVRERGIQIAMIAVPATQAQQVCDTLVKARVRAILNYTSVRLTVPENVRVQYIDPVMHLQRMTYYLE